MANEPSWEDIFKPQPDSSAPGQQPAQPATPAPQPAYPPTQAYPQQPAQAQQPADEPDPFALWFAQQPTYPGQAPVEASGIAYPPAQAQQPAAGAPLPSRRELREAEARSRPAEPVSVGQTGGGRGGSGGGPSGRFPTPPRKKRRLLWLKITLPIVLVLGAAAGVAAYAWLNYEEQVRELLGWELPNDYEGTGNGDEAIVTIQSGDIGSDVANTLHDQGVTMTFDAFYDLLLAQDENVNFQPGNYTLQKEMSAQSALDALLDPANKITDKLLIIEGTTLPSALEIMAETTGIPLEELQAAAADLASFGLPVEAPSLEGYLFPATYQLDGGQSAHDVLQLLVTTMFQHLDAAGVPVADRHRVLTMAALIQREAGPNLDDFYKISRVFQNRLDQGINLESDATVGYGTGNLHTVWTTDAERADASNPYNTYANPGLPIGPIGAPGDLAIDAALHPADGPWLFFVTINLATGETFFSETADQHEGAVAQLRAWCRASEENASYCE